MIGGMSGVGKNIIPYGLYMGIRENLRGLNIIGLKRNNISSEKINLITNIFKKIFNKDNNIEQNIDLLTDEEKEHSTNK